MAVTEIPISAPPFEVHVEARPVPEVSVRRPAQRGTGAGARVGMRFGRTAAWLGARRPSTLVASLAIFTMGPLVLLSTLSVNSIYSTLTAASNHRLADASALASASLWLEAAVSVE